MRFVRRQRRPAVMVGEFIEASGEAGKGAGTAGHAERRRGIAPAASEQMLRLRQHGDNRLAARLPNSANLARMPKLALLSVSDKRGLVEFAAALVGQHGYTLLSTGGTAKLLAEKGLPVTEVSQHTGFPEIMEGRVKTLHPKIHGGLLCRRDKAEHLAQAARNEIALIDLVVVNLYPFEETVAKPHVTLEEAIENIDIGGPSMLRSAAKNHESVTVVCDPADYAAVLAALASEATQPELLAALRPKLALKVFQRTGSYDTAIARYLEGQQAAYDV